MLRKYPFAGLLKSRAVELPHSAGIFCVNPFKLFVGLSLILFVISSRADDHLYMHLLAWFSFTSLR